MKDPKNWCVVINRRHAAARQPTTRKQLRKFILLCKFRKFAHDAACAMGTSWAFFLASVVVVVWGITGPVFGFSDTWQLVINTGTSVVTFLMVF
jgi:hypothetical protein